MNSLHKKPKTYFPDLDVMRFLAFLPMFCYHSFPRQIQSESFVLQLLTYINGLGYLTIDFFFVLSSFLLTYLGITEYQKQKHFSAKYFLIRRTLRIWPLYFLVVGLAYFVIAPLGQMAGMAFDLPSIWYYLLFASNYCPEAHITLLMIFWSIAVEEQFYVLWALLLKLFLKNIKMAIGILFASFFLYKCIAIPNNWPVYTHTINYFANFAFGAMIAVFSHSNSSHFQNFRQWSATQIAIAYFICISTLTAIPLLYQWHPFYYLDNIVVSMCFAYIIMEQCFCDNSLFKLRNVKRLIYPGQITYGMYVYHGLFITFSSKLVAMAGWGEGIRMLFAIPNLLLTFLLAHFSYQYFERHFLGWKAKFRPY